MSFRQLVKMMVQADLERLNGKKKLHVAILGPVYPFTGGISNYNSELCNHLSKHAILKVISYARALPSFVSFEQKNDPSKNCLRSPVQFIFDILRSPTWNKTAQAIIDFKPDVLIFHWYMPFFAFPFYYPFYRVFKTVKKGCNCKIIAICHELFPHENTLAYKLINSLRASKMHASLSEKIDFFLVHTDKDFKRLPKIFPKTNVQKIFHPIYDVFYKKMGKLHARKLLHLKGNVLLCFGFVAEYKGISYLQEAVPEILKDAKLSLLIVGKFVAHKKIYLEKIRKLNIGEHLKIIDRYVPNEDIPIYFSAADLVVAPYISATQSGIVTIAYAFNKPVLATKVGGLPEMVHDNKTGYLVEPKNSKQLADAVLRFFKSGDQKRFSSEIKRVKKQLSWNSLCKRILHIVE